MPFCPLHRRRMERPGSEGSCYYSVLGIRRNASVAEIRGAYRKLAMKWHPDKWTKDPTVLGEAKKRFQQIQEAYSVLSDEGKRSMYDVGLYDPFEEEDEGFADFMQEMLSMMDNVRAEKGHVHLMGPPKSLVCFEDLQKMFVEMVGGPSDSSRSSRTTGARTAGAVRRGRVNASSFL
ncbi:hypothetical protein ACLOJK_026341 [Asimina triloba]